MCELGKKSVVQSLVQHVHRLYSLRLPSQLTACHSTCSTYCCADVCIVTEHKEKSQKSNLHHSKCSTSNKHKGSMKMGYYLSFKAVT